MITLNYTIGEQEYKDFYYFMGWLSPDRKAFRTRYHLTSLVAYLAVFILLFFITNSLSFNISTALILLVTGIAFYLYNNFRVKRHYYNYGKKVYEQSEKESSEMIIGETGITVKDKSAEANYKWTAFSKKYERTDVYYLYMSSSLALIIPKRVFRSASEKEDFEKLLAQHLPLHADLPTV
jgi:c-di-AMP phosphodiesterase-like protein